MQMLNSFKKVSAVVLTGALVMTGCSFGSGKKPNTMEPDQILTAAKKELFENAKKSFKTNLEYYEEDYVKGITDWPSMGDFTFSVNVDAGENGKLEASLSEEFKVDMSEYKSMDMDSTLYDMIKAGSGEAKVEIKVKAEFPPLSEMEGSVKFTVLQDKGAYYFRLDEVVIPENIPGASADEIKLVVDVYKGQWFKVDLAKVIEGNEMVKAFFDQTLRQLSSVNAEKMSEVFDAYVDDVIMKKQWVELDKGSKEDTDRGDRYKVVMKQESTKEFILETYDFFEANIETIDEIVDFTGQNNPFMVAPAMTIDEIRSELRDGRSGVESDLNSAELPDVEFHATFSGDKLAVWSFAQDLGKIDGSDVTGNFNMDWVFEDEKQDFEYSHIDAKLDVKPNNEEGSLTMTANINVPEGKDRAVKAEMKFESDADGTFTASLDAASNKDDRTVTRFKMNFNLDAKEELEDGMNGIDGAIDYNGSSKKLTGSIKSTPDGKLFDISMNGDFGDDEGDAKFEFAVNPPNDDTVKGDLGLEYEVSDDKVSFELPGDIDQAQDFTMIIEQALGSAFGAPAMFMTPGMAPGMVEGGEIPADVMMEGIPTTDGTGVPSEFNF